MAHYTDWLSTTRDGQLAMAKDWVSVTGTNAHLWGIPLTAVQELGGLTEAADTALTAAKNETTRTLVATAQCREAFDALIAAMRDMKRRYFLTLPLVDSDYISLGLKPHDATPTTSGMPAAQATIETCLAGRHELGVKIIYVTGSPADPANKGFRIMVQSQGRTNPPPRTPAICGNPFTPNGKKT